MGICASGHSASQVNHAWRPPGASSTSQRPRRAGRVRSRPRLRPANSRRCGGAKSSRKALKPTIPPSGAPSAATRCDKGGLVDGTGRRSSDSFLKLPTLRLGPLQACGDLELCTSDGRSRLAVACGGAVICDWAVLVLSNGDEPLNLLDGGCLCGQSRDEIVQRPLLSVVSTGQAAQVVSREPARDEEPFGPVDLRLEVPVVADPVAARAGTLRHPLQERRARAAREPQPGLMRTLGSGGREHQRGEAGLQTLVVALVAGTTAGVAQHVHGVVRHDPPSTVATTTYEANRNGPSGMEPRRRGT